MRKYENLLENENFHEFTWNACTRIGCFSNALWYDVYKCLWLPFRINWDINFKRIDDNIGNNLNVLFNLNSIQTNELHYRMQQTDYDVSIDQTNWLIEREKINYYWNDNAWFDMSEKEKKNCQIYTCLLWWNEMETVWYNNIEIHHHFV